MSHLGTQVFADFTTVEVQGETVACALFLPVMYILLQSGSALDSNPPVAVLFFGYKWAYNIQEPMFTQSKSNPVKGS